MKHSVGFSVRISQSPTDVAVYNTLIVIGWSSFQNWHFDSVTSSLFWKVQQFINLILFNQLFCLDIVSLIEKLCGKAKRILCFCCVPSAIFLPCLGNRKIGPNLIYKFCRPVFYVGFRRLYPSQRLKTRERRSYGQNPTFRDARWMFPVPINASINCNKVSIAWTFEGRWERWRQIMGLFYTLLCRRHRKWYQLHLVFTALRSNN